MKKKANFFAIGVFVIAALIVASVSVVVFGSGALNKQTTTLLVTFEGSANGLRAGSKVKAYGVEIGSVESVMLHQDPKTQEIYIPTILEIDLTTLSAVMGDERELEFTEEDYKEALAQGIHAKLATQSMVTGQLFVDIKYDPEVEGFMLDDERFAGYRSIPTVPTDMAVMMGSVRNIVQNLGQMDVAALIESLTGTVNDVRDDLGELDFKALQENLDGLLASSRAKIDSPDLQKAIVEAGNLMASFRQFGDLLNQKGGTTIDEIDATLLQTRNTLGEVEIVMQSADSWVNPDSLFYQEIISVVDQMADAARSLRILLDYVERNPSSFITGKKTEEAK